MSNSTVIILQIIEVLLFISILNVFTFSQKLNQKAAYNIFSPIDITFASKCIVNVTQETVKPKHMVTILNSNITKEPGYSLMSTVTKMLHKMTDHYTVCYEITNGTLLNFQSFAKCIENCNSKNETTKIYKHFFKNPRKTQMYLVFIDSLEDFYENLMRIESMKTYNISAEFFLVYTNLHQNTKDLAQDILQITYDKSKFATTLLIPSKKDVFELYTFDLFAQEAKYCATQPVLTLLNTCNRGNFNLKVYRHVTDYSRLNCSIRVALMHFPPYVISRNHGVEVLILHLIEKHLNVSFEKSYHNIAGSWGYKMKDGNWSGLLNTLYYDRFMIGAGAVSYIEDRLIDFDYSLDFFSEKMFWIAPTANLVEKWKLLLIIFKWSTWLSLLASLILITLLLWFSSNRGTGTLDKSFKKFPAAILTTVQVTISIPAGRQPRMLANRILFISYAFFIILVASFYQSALITVLTEPKYEHQISSDEEVVESSLTIGGIRNFKAFFNISHSHRAMVIHNKYTYYTEDEGMEYWMKRVAKGEALTIQGEFFTKFYQKLKLPELTNEDGSSKLYIIANDDDVVIIDTYRFIFSKNFFLKTQINGVIEHLINGGFINLWAKYYVHYYQGELTMDEYEQNYDNHEVVLTMKHLEGAFTLILFGNFLGMCAFIIELLIYVYKTKSR